MLFSWCALVFATSPAPLAGDALTPYRGQPVLSVDVLAPPAEDAHMLRELIDIQPGFLVSSDDVQASLKRLYALGRFSDVGVTAERMSGTVSLHFYVRPIRRLDHLEVEGAAAVNEGALRAALKLEAGDEVDSRTEPALRERALSYLRRAGFPDADVSVEALPSEDPVLAIFALRLTEGTPLKVRAVRFVGRPRLDRAVLERLVRTRPGSILDQEVLEADAAALVEAFHNHGFLNATLERPRVEVTDGAAVVAFKIEAGDRIYVEVFGNRVLSKVQLLKEWPETDGVVRDNDVHVFAERIADAYRRLGYFRAKVAARGGRNAALERITYRLHIDEGPLFRVVTLKFAGARAFTPELLTAQLHAYLRNALHDDTLVERLTRTDVCLGAPQHLGALQRGQQACPLSIVPPESRWVPEVFDAALEELKAAYHNLGFLQAEVGPAEATVANEEIDVAVPIVEGPQTFITSISFAGNEALAASELLEEIERGSALPEAGATPIRPGSAFSAAGIEDGRIAIVRRYRDTGYLYAQVITDTEVAADRLSAKLIYRVEEGPQVRVQRVLVRGNRYTRDRIIRSRLSLQSGDVYRLDQALQDQRSIAALGVFSNVRVKLIDEERPDERKDLVAEVAERNRQPVELSAGLSSADGPRLGASYSHINLLGTASAFTSSVRANRKVFFDLYGRFAGTMQERYANFSYLEQIEREVRVGVRSPPIKSLPLDPAVRLDLIHERENAIPYSLASYTAILGFDFVVGHGLTFSLEPQVSLTDLECVVIADIGGGCSAEAQTRRIDVGRRQAFKVGPTVSYDHRDNPFNPHRGVFASAKAVYVVGQQQTAAQPGFSFTHIEGSFTGYVPMGAATLALSARGGKNTILQGQVPIDERFFLGGRSTLRGFPEGSTLIAEDACVLSANDAFPAGCTERVTRPASGPPLTTGGNFMLLGRAELRVPVTESLSIGLFVDAGNLWVRLPAGDNLRFRVGTGTGLRYATPVGPLALDIGLNTNPRPINGEPSRPQPHFTVGVF